MFRRRLESFVKSLLRSFIDRLMEQRSRLAPATQVVRPPVPIVKAPTATPVKPAAKKPAKPEIGRLTAASAHQGTVWIPRILWALHEADGHGGKSAAELARILATEAKLKVAPNNVARAFRDLKGKPYAKGLWTVRDKKYTITKAGQALLTKIL